MPSCCCQTGVVIYLWRQPFTWAGCKAKKQDLANWSSCASEECIWSWYRHWTCFLHCFENTQDHLCEQETSWTCRMWQCLWPCNDRTPCSYILVQGVGVSLPLKRPHCALGLSWLLATGLGNGMAARAPAANAGGTEQGGTENTEEMEQDLAYSKCRKGHGNSHFQKDASRRHRPRLSFH